MKQQRQTFRIPGKGQTEVQNLEGKVLQVRFLPTYRNEGDRPKIGPSTSGLEPAKYGATYQFGKFREIRCVGTEASKGDLLQVKAYPNPSAVEQLPRKIEPGLERLSYQFGPNTITEGGEDLGTVVPSGRKHALRLRTASFILEGANLTRGTKVRFETRTGSTLNGVSELVTIRSETFPIREGVSKIVGIEYDNQIIPPGTKTKTKVDLFGRNLNGGSLDVTVNHNGIIAKNAWVAPA